MDIIRFAEFYTKRLGWSLLPVAAKGKVPTKPEWPIIATTDMGTVRQWLDENPLMNIGLLCGQTSGIVVLDIDPHNGGEESLLAITAQYGKLPDTVECLTGGGGRHIYFAHPGVRIGNSSGDRNPLGPGLDIRGDGGFVVVPPSLHVSGNYYEWEPSCKPSSTAIAPMPDWMVELLTQKATISAPPVPEHITEGARNDLLTSLAGTMRRRGMEYDSIYAALQVENDNKCDPPLVDKEVMAIAKSVSRYAPEETTAFSGNGGNKSSDKQPQNKQVEFREPMDARASVMKFIDLLNNLDGRSIPTYITPIDSSLGGLERKTLTVIAARPSMGKSTLAWQIALNASAAGHKVYFFSLEMSAESLWAKTACGAVGVRWKDLRAGNVPQEQIEQVINKAKELAERHAGTLLIDDGTNTSETIWRGVEFYKPDVVIIDHLRLVADRDEGREDQRLGLITQRFKDMAKQFNCVVIVLAQLNRSVESRDDKRPYMSDLRDSGQVEENSDLILTIYRADYYDDTLVTPPVVSKTELLVRKFRDDVGRQKIMLGFDTKRQWFDSITVPAQRVVAGKNGHGG